MIFDEVYEKAYKNQPMDELSNIAEKYAYLQLLNLCKDYKNELISKDEATRQKLKIQKEFNNYQDRIKKYYDVFKNQNDLRGKYQQYIISIEKSQNQDDLLENALKFIEVVIQDDSFFERNYKKQVDF